MVLLDCNYPVTIQYPDMKARVVISGGNVRRLPQGLTHKAYINNVLFCRSEIIDKNLYLLQIDECTDSSHTVSNINY